MMGGLREPQPKADADSDIEDVSPAVDIPPPLPTQVDDQPGFADFGDGAEPPSTPSPVPTAPSPVPPPRPPQPDFTNLAEQTPATTANTTTEAINKEQPMASLEKPSANIAKPRPTSPRAPSPGIVLPPPVSSQEVPEAPAAPTTTEEAAPQQAPQPKWEAGFEDNFSDLGLASEVKATGTTDVDAAFKPASPQPPAQPQLLAQPQAQTEPQPELQPQASPREPSPSPEPERAKSPCLVTCRTIYAILACCDVHRSSTHFVDCFYLLYLTCHLIIYPFSNLYQCNF